MKEFSLLFAFLLVTTLGLAQDITGYVRSANGSPLENASVGLISARDSSIIAGTSTNSDGYFRLTGANPDTCLLMVSRLGYETRWLRPQFKMEISLEEHHIEIGEVTVTAKRPLYTHRGGQLFANVADTHLSRAGSMLDILGRLPGILRKGDALEAYVRGNVLVYVDNQPVRMEQVAHMDVSTVDRVEIIQNPGAEYPSGTAVVLKIRTRRLLGLSTFVTGWARGARRFSYGSDAKVQYRTGAWDFNLSGKLADRSSYGGQEIEETHPDRHALTKLLNDSRSQVLGGVAEIGYSPSQTSSWVLNYEYAPSQFHGTATGQRLRSMLMGEDLREMKSLSDIQQHMSPHAMNTYLRHSFSQRMSLEVSGNAKFQWDEKETRIHETIWQTQSGEKTQFERGILATENVSYFIGGLRGKLSYALAPGHKLEGGVSYGFTRIKSGVKDDSPFQNDAQNLTQEHSASGFINYAGTLFQRLQLHIGARYEHIGSLRAQRAQDSKRRYSFSDIVPTGSITLMTGPLQHQLRYNYWLQHPRFWSLAGLGYYVNEEQKRVGNTDLRTARTHSLSYSLGHRFFFLAAEYSRTNDAITDVMRLKDGVITSQESNFRKHEMLTAMGNVHYQWGVWMPSLTLQTLFNWHPELEEGERKAFNMKPLLGVSFSNNFNFPWGMTLAVDLAYNTSGSQLYMLIDQGATVNCSITQSFLKNHLTLGLYAEDIFYSSSKIIRLELYNIRSTVDNWWDSRRIMLKASYFFNKMIHERRLPSAIEQTLRRAN